MRRLVPDQTVVTAIEVARLVVDRSVNCYLTGMGTLEVVPVMAYLLSMGRARYVVDTGPPAEAECARYHRPLVPGSRRDIVRSLAALGVSDLDGVIVTHLHWDHAGNLANFGPDVPVFVQRSELDYALSPLPAHRRAYSRAWAKGGEDLRALLNLKVLEGSAVIAGGIQVVHTPGHSPGSQCVLVQERDAVVAIAGDTVPTPSNLTGRVPCGVHTCITDWYESLERLEAAATAVYPGHGGRVAVTRVAATVREVAHCVH